MSLILSGTNGVSDVDGTAATPAIRGTDTNTGIFFPAADTIAFAEGGVESARLDSAGNFGLGVTPSAWSAFRALDINTFGALASTTDRIQVSMNNFWNGSSYIYKTSAAASIYNQTGGQHQWLTAPSGTAGNAISFTQAMTLDASGNWLLGSTSSPGTVWSSARTFAYVKGSSTNNSGEVIVESNNGNQQASFFASGSSAEFGLWSTKASAIIFGTNSAERARITSGGDFCIGTTSRYLNTLTVSGGVSSIASEQFNISSTNSSTGFEWVLRQGNEMRFYVSNATVLARLTASGVWTNASDARYKENIRPAGYGLAEVMQLQPRAYNIIGSDKQEIGFVAQEVEPLIPELVESTTNSVTGEDRLSLSYGQLSAVLVKAIQEQQALIAEQSQLITALTARVAALENK